MNKTNIHIILHEDCLPNWKGIDKLICVMMSYIVHFCHKALLIGMDLDTDFQYTQYCQDTHCHVDILLSLL